MQKTLFTLLIVLCLTSAFKVDIPICIQGVADFSKQIKNIVDNASFEKQSMGKFLNNTFTAFQGLNPLMESCGLDFDFMDSVMSYKPTSQQDCFQSAANFISFSNNTYQLYQSNQTLDQQITNYFNFTVEMFSEVRKMYKHCWVVKDQKQMLGFGFSEFKNFDLQSLNLKCFTYAQNISSQAVAFVKNTINKSKPIPDLFVDVAYIYNTASDALPLCGLNITLPKIDNIEDKKFCVNNLNNIIQSVNETIYDFKSKNYTDIPSELQKIGTNIFSMINKCKANKKPMLQAFTSCFSNSKGLFENIVSLVNDIKNKEDISETIPQLYNIVKSLQPLVNSCGLPIDLHIHLIDVKDLQHCIKDFEAIEKTLVALKNDIEEKKITNIAKDASAIVSEITSAIKECKATSKFVAE